MLRLRHRDFFSHVDSLDGRGRDCLLFLNNGMLCCREWNFGGNSGWLVRDDHSGRWLEDGGLDLSGEWHMNIYHLGDVFSRALRVLGRRIIIVIWCRRNDRATPCQLLCGS